MKKDSKPHTIAAPVFADDRGTFVPFWELGNTIKVTPVKRVYYVTNSMPGVIRGFHFHKKEWKYFIIAQGSAKFVALDPKNPAERFIFVSSSRKANVIVIPPGFANGWVSLSEETILICCSSLTTKESLKDDIRFDPFKWGDVWSVKSR